MDRLCSGLLAPVDFEDRTLVTAAISAPSSHEHTNYQRLEFLGDSILKLSSSMALMAKHLIYDEGRLSKAKDHIGTSLLSAPDKVSRAFLGLLFGLLLLPLTLCSVHYLGDAMISAKSGTMS